MKWEIKKHITVDSSMTEIRETWHKFSDDDKKKLLQLKDEQDEAPLLIITAEQLMLRISQIVNEMGKILEFLMNEHQRLEVPVNIQDKHKQTAVMFLETKSDKEKRGHCFGWSRNQQSIPEYY